ncbi:MAG: VOC family protein [Ignavibacteria bacterium]|nr:VOC family protein [Ignavibacteria bacterium]
MEKITPSNSQKIFPYLWFNGNLEEAVRFYTSTFSNSRILSMNIIPENISMATFELEGLQFMALDGGPYYAFSPAVSFYIHCDTQDEIDNFWNAFIDGGGQELQCGWLTDKFGVTWQIIPSILGKLMTDPDTERSNRVVQAMLKMKKIIIADLLQAHEN